MNEARLAQAQPEPAHGPRLSTGDAVRLPDGRAGVIRGHDGQGGYCVVVPGVAHWLRGTEADLEPLSSEDVDWAA
jgi:hypothetical protein